MNLIEVTIQATGKRSTVNVDKVETFDEQSDGHTQITFSEDSYIVVNESYEEIKSLLSQMSR